MSVSICILKGCKLKERQAEIERLTAELAAAKHWESMWAEAQLDIVDLKAELAAAKERHYGDCAMIAKLLGANHVVEEIRAALTDTKE